jgi:uncharacterized protein (TIGR02996 family)
MYDLNDEGQALVNGIIENPDDIAPRLVFADWLDENGKPEWATLIRDMIYSRWVEWPRGLSRLFPGLPRKSIILTDAPFGGPKGLMGQSVIVRNGFIEGVYLTPARWWWRGPALARGNPIRHVHLTRVRPFYVQAEDSDTGTPYWFWDQLPDEVAHLVPARWEGPKTKEEECRARKQLSDALLALARSDPKIKGT